LTGGGYYMLDGNTYFLKGITSSTLFINNRCDINEYAVYTNVHEYLDWIKEIVAETTTFPPSQELIDLKCTFVDDPQDIISKFASGFWQKIDVEGFA